MISLRLFMVLFVIGITLCVDPGNCGKRKDLDEIFELESECVRKTFAWMQKRSGDVSQKALAELQSTWEDNQKFYKMLETFSRKKGCRISSLGEICVRGNFKGWMDRWGQSDLESVLREIQNHYALQREDDDGQVAFASSNPSLSATLASLKGLRLDNIFTVQTLNLHISDNPGEIPSINLTRNIRGTIPQAPDPYAPGPQLCLQVAEGLPTEQVKSPYPEAVIGRVDRRYVVNPDQLTRFPYSACAHLSLIFSDGAGSGSGSFVGPRHLLTARHCVYDEKTKEYVTSIRVHPALNGKRTPFGEARVSKFFTFTNSSHDFDMALLVLDRPLGQRCGYFGIACFDGDLSQSFFSPEFNIAGYPGDRGDCQIMHAHEGRILEIKPERVAYDIDTYAGQSGSGLWQQSQANGYYVIGVHTHGVRGAPNEGTRISRFKYDYLIRWINSTWAIQ